MHFRRRTKFCRSISAACFLRFLCADDSARRGTAGAADAFGLLVATAASLFSKAMFSRPMSSS
jgi:hypothetical protein